MGRNRYEYRLRNKEEEYGYEKSTKDLYMIGLFVGSFLKRNMFYTSRTKKNMSILAALRGGQNVYFMARDMSIIWKMFKDEYPNAAIVGGVNRKTMGGVTQERLIKCQVDLDHKGLVVDSGFTGSCVMPVINLSKKYHNKNTGNDDKFLKGLLFSGTPSSYYPFLRDSNKSRSHRTVIYELEHCPKTEKYDYADNQDRSAYSVLDKNILLKSRAFELGFRSGVMGLNQHLLKKQLSLEAYKREYKSRINNAREANRELRRNLLMLDDTAKNLAQIEKYGQGWFVRGGKLERKPLTPNNVEYAKSRNHKGYFIRKDNAQRYLALQEQITARRMDHRNSNWFKYTSVEDRVKNHLNAIKQLQDRIDQINKQWGKEINEPFHKLSDIEHVIKAILSGKHTDKSKKFLSQYDNLTLPAMKKLVPEVEIEGKYTWSDSTNAHVLNGLKVHKSGDDYYLESTDSLTLSYTTSTHKQVMIHALLLLDLFREHLCIRIDGSLVSAGQEAYAINHSNLRQFCSALVEYASKNHAH